MIDFGNSITKNPSNIGIEKSLVHLHLHGFASSWEHMEFSFTGFGAMTAEAMSSGCRAWIRKLSHIETALIDGPIAGQPKPKRRKGADLSRLPDFWPEKTVHGDSKHSRNVLQENRLSEIVSIMFLTIVRSSEKGDQNLRKAALTQTATLKLPKPYGPPPRCTQNGQKDRLTSCCASFHFRSATWTS
jgi:hypothetical protein